jgi:hypothetical protein
MSETLITKIPGIGKTFAKDFALVGYNFIEDFEGKKAETIFELLVKANTKENHKTSKNYLYVIRMISYYAKGGRETEQLKWSYWKDK